MKGQYNDQQLQLKDLKKMIKQTRAYSLYYYKCAKLWRQRYWITIFIPVICSVATSIINVALDKCDDNLKNYNSIITAIIAGVTLAMGILDSSSRRRLFEKAGDDYNALSMAIYRDVFSINDNNYQDLSKIIEKYSFRIEDYISFYDEPPRNSIKEIMKNMKLELM